MRTVVCKHYAGETISVHEHSVAFDADGICLGVVTTDDFGKMALEPLPDREVDYLANFEYVQVIEECADPAPVAEMAVVADDDPGDLGGLSSKDLRALAKQHGVRQVGMKRDAVEAALKAALEAE